MFTSCPLVHWLSLVDVTTRKGKKEREKTQEQNMTTRLLVLVCLSALLVLWVCGTVEGGTYSVAHRKQGSLVKQRIDPDVQRKKMVANFKLMKEKKLTAYLDDDPFDEKVCSPEDEPVVVPTRVPTEEEIEEMIARREKHMENLWYLGYCGDQQKWRGEWSRRGSFTHAKFRVGRIFDDAVVERPRLQRKWELVQGLGAERAEHKASEDNVIAMTAAQLEMIKWLPCYNGVHIHVNQQRSSKNAMKLRDVVALVAQADYDPASGQGALTQATFKSHPPVSEEDVRTYRPHEDMNRERVWWSLYPPEVDCYVGVSAHLAKTLRLWVGDTIHIKALSMVEDSNHLSATLLPQIPDPLPNHSMLMLVAGFFTSTCERVTPKHPYMIGSRIYQPTVGVASLGKEAQYPTAMTVARIDANSTSIIGMSPAALDLFAVPLKGRMPSFTVEALQRFQKDNYEDNTLLYRLPVVLPPRPRVRGEDPTVVTAAIEDLSDTEVSHREDAFGRISLCSLSQNMADRLSVGVGDILVIRGSYDIGRLNQMKRVEERVREEYREIGRQQKLVDLAQKEEERVKAVWKDRDPSAWAAAFNEKKKKKMEKEKEANQIDSSIPSVEIL